MKERVRVWSGFKCRNMTCRASDRGEDLLSRVHLLIHVSALSRCEETHKTREVVDSAPARTGIANIFRVRKRIAQAHPLGWNAERAFMRENVVRDTHLVAIRISAKSNQRRVLGLP